MIIDQLLMVPFIRRFLKIQKLNKIIVFIKNYCARFHLICVWRHCVKNVQIRSFFWSVFFCIQSEYRKIRIFFYCHCVKSVQIRSFFWSVFSHIRTEYGEILNPNTYSARMRGNTDQKKLCVWTLFTQ